MIQGICFISLSLLFIGILLSLIRVIKGPSLADRAIAADVIALNLIGLIVVYSVLMQTTFYFDLVLVFSLLAFISLVCFAKFLGRGRIVE